MFFKKKKKTEEVNKDYLSIRSIDRYDQKVNAFKRKNGGYMDILRVISKDLDNLNDDDITMNMIKITMFLRTYPKALKLIFLNFPINLKPQIENLKKIKERTHDSVRLKWIDREITELEIAEESVERKEYFMMIFSESTEEMEKLRIDITQGLNTYVNKIVEEIDLGKKLIVLRKMNNMNTEISIDDFGEVI